MVEGFDSWCLDLLCSLDELEGFSHVEDELVADKLGGSVIIIGAD